MFIFEIHGIPVAQKQTRFSCINNKPRTWDPSSKEKEIIQWQVKPLAPSEPLKGPIEMILTFLLPIPKSASKALRKAMINRVVLPIKKPDIDNLAYLVTNALKKIVYEDDSQIVAQKIFKFYSEKPGTIIQIKPIQQSQQIGYHEDDI